MIKIKEKLARCGKWFFVILGMNIFLGCKTNYTVITKNVEDFKYIFNYIERTRDRLDLAWNMEKKKFCEIYYENNEPRVKVCNDSVLLNKLRGKNVTSIEYFGGKEITIEFRTKALWQKRKFLIKFLGDELDFVGYQKFEKVDDRIYYCRSKPSIM